MATYTFDGIEGGKTKFKSSAEAIGFRTTDSVTLSVTGTVVTFIARALGGSIIAKYLIDKVTDIVVIDGTSHAANSYATADDLADAVNILFPDANSGDGGSGTFAGLTDDPMDNTSLAEDFDSVNNVANFGYNDDIDYPKGYTLTKKGAVIAKGGGGFKNNLVESPMVFWDYKIGKYRMVFVGYSGVGSPIAASLGYATSPDLETWSEFGTSFFGASGTIGAPDRYGTSGPYVWLENNTYYLYYISLDGPGYEGGTKRLCLATSTDFITWTRLGAVISPFGSGWRSVQVYHPCIVKHRGIYYMFFNAADSGTLNESIGYATSTDLLTWTVDDVNSPILQRTGGNNNWESNLVGDPVVYKIGRVWYMAYYGAAVAGGASDGIATTTEELFPLGWTRFSGNPVLTMGSAGSIDDTYAHKPFIMVTAAKHYHWYTAVSNAISTRQIAVAVQSHVQSEVTGGYNGTMAQLYLLITAATAFPATGLLGYWAFEQASGTFTDGSGNGKDLTRVNSVTTGAGKVSNGAIMARLSSQYLTGATTGLSANTGFTMAGWFKLNSYGINTYQILVAKDSSTLCEYSIFFNETAAGGGAGDIKFKSTLAGTGQVLASQSYTAGGLWTFVVAKWSGTAISISVNRNTPVTTAMATMYTSSALQFRIGNTSDGSNAYLNGAADEIGIWDRALTTDEEDYLYAAGIGRTKT